MIRQTASLILFIGTYHSSHITHHISHITYHTSQSHRPIGAKLLFELLICCTWRTITVWSWPSCSSLHPSHICRNRRDSRWPGRIGIVLLPPGLDLIFHFHFHLPFPFHIWIAIPIYLKDGLHLSFLPSARFILLAGSLQSRGV